MNTTEIPNGYVVRGPTGKNAMVEIDFQGGSAEHAQEIELSGWPDLVDKVGVVMDNTIVLVHIVRGDTECLFKRLRVNHLNYNGEHLTVKDVARQGKLPTIIKNMWDEYMAELDEKDVEALLNEKVLT